MMICDRLNQLLTAYQVQDHQCTKCKSIRHDSLSLYCECCSPFVPQITPDQLKTEATTVKTVAGVRNFVLSGELAKWILDML